MKAWHASLSHFSKKWTQSPDRWKADTITETLDCLKPGWWCLKRHLNANQSENCAWANHTPSLTLRLKPLPWKPSVWGSLDLLSMNCLLSLLVSSSKCCVSFNTPGVTRLAYAQVSKRKPGSVTCLDYHAQHFGSWMHTHTHTHMHTHTAFSHLQQQGPLCSPPSVWNKPISRHLLFYFPCL